MCVPYIGHLSSLHKTQCHQGCLFAQCRQSCLCAQCNQGCLCAYLQLRQGSVVSRSQDVLSALVPAVVDDDCDGEMAGVVGGPASNLLEALGEQAAAGAKVKICGGEDLRNARHMER